jgi:hypothetical protein
MALNANRVSSLAGICSMVVSAASPGGADKPMRLMAVVARINLIFTAVFSFLGRTFEAPDEDASRPGWNSSFVPFSKRVGGRCS